MLRRDLDDLYDHGQVGDWCFHEADQDLFLFLRYPVKDEQWLAFYAEAPELNRGDVTMLPLSGEGHLVWQWDGNREAPTLSPSINVIGRWHGYLRAGKLETV